MPKFVPCSTSVAFGDNTPKGDNYRGSYLISRPDKPPVGVSYYFTKGAPYTLDPFVVLYFPERNPGDQLVCVRLANFKEPKMEALDICATALNTTKEELGEALLAHLPEPIQEDRDLWLRFVGTTPIEHVLILENVFIFARVPDSEDTRDRLRAVATRDFPELEQGQIKFESYRWGPIVFAGLSFMPLRSWTIPDVYKPQQYLGL